MAKKQAAFPAGKDTATGPYSPALVVGEWVFVSGQGPLDAGGKVAGDTVEEQTDQTLQNVRAALEAAGCTMDDCVKVTVHLSDVANFARFNGVYMKFFGKPYPTRTLVQSVMHGHIRVEIDAIAIKGCGS